MTERAGGERPESSDPEMIRDRGMHIKGGEAIDKERNTRKKVKCVMSKNLSKGGDKSGL